MLHRAFFVVDSLLMGWILHLFLFPFSPKLFGIFLEILIPSSRFSLLALLCLRISFMYNKQSKCGLAIFANFMNLV